ncbi:Sua5 family C-terminal domain-containing protein, partial [Bdellovibrionota bacterium FG-1]
SNPIAAGMLAPGMLDSHYAPSKPMFMLPATIPHLEAQHWEEIVQRAAGAQHLGFLLQKDEDPQIDERIVHHLLTPGGAAHHPRITALCLSSNGDLHEAARTLFSKMRALDTSDAQVIFAEPCASIHGLGHAIADRLGRACQNSIQ